ncbi:MAG: pantoate--beta-alanine ligase [Acetobacterales bacterium]
MEVVRSVAELRRRLLDWRTAGERVALVPTMGALHAGHVSLLSRGRETAGRLCATIFVNPRQFGPTEDFARYPRDEAGDLETMASAGTDLVFAPAIREVYPADFATEVRVTSELASILEGGARPGFFTGVATVVTKLLLQALPDLALFGEKDYQQLLVIRQLVRDLDIPVEVAGCPTVREADGLALSSRNRFLADQERRRAPALHAALGEGADALAGGADPAGVAAAGVSRLRDAGFDPVDYFEVRDAATLMPLPADWRSRGIAPRLLAAARLGGTRLIDNVGLAAGR